MNMKKTYILLVIIFVVAIIIVILLFINQTNHNPNLLTSDITLPINPRSDAVDPGSIENECQSRMEYYVQSSEFTNREFTRCELIESKVGYSEKECPNGFSPQGCSICKLKCG